jgi:hypothetical protein
MTSIATKSLISDLDQFSDEYLRTNQGKRILNNFHYCADKEAPVARVDGIFRALSNAFFLEYSRSLNGVSEEKMAKVEFLDFENFVTEKMDALTFIVRAKDITALNKYLNTSLSGTRGGGDEEKRQLDEETLFRSVFPFNETTEEMKEREIGAALLIVGQQGYDEAYGHLVNRLGLELAIESAHLLKDAVTSGSEGESTGNEGVKSSGQKKKARQKARKELARSEQEEKKKLQAEADEKIKSEQKGKRDLAILKQEEKKKLEAAENLKEEKKKKELERLEAQRKQAVKFVRSPGQIKKKLVGASLLRSSDSDFTKSDVTIGESSSTDTGKEVKPSRKSSDSVFKKEESSTLRTINSPFEMPDIFASWREGK